MGRHSLKLGDGDACGDAWSHWSSFSNSLSPIDPFIRLAFTQWPPFLIICNPFSSISHRAEWPLLKLSCFTGFLPEKFCQKCVKICILSWKLVIFPILSVWSPSCRKITMIPIYRIYLVSYGAGARGPAFRVAVQTSTSGHFQSCVPRAAPLENGPCIPGRHSNGKRGYQARPWSHPNHVFFRYEKRP